MKRRGSPAHRWYLCECGDRTCREEFFMRVRDYDTITLADGVRVVVPGHTSPGWEVVEISGGALAVRKKRRTDGREQGSRRETEI
jgi:hypothetical protein